MKLGVCQNFVGSYVLCETVVRSPGATLHFRETRGHTQHPLAPCVLRRVLSHHDLSLEIPRLLGALYT